MRSLSLCLVAAASECGPTDVTLVTDGYYPAQARATLSDEIKSSHFDIKYGANFKVVTNLYAREQYVLTHCGSTAPTDVEVDAVAPLPAESAGGAGGFACGTMACEDGGPFFRKHFTIPLKSYGDETGTTHGYTDILGVHDRISYMSASAFSPCLQKALGCDSSMATPGTWGNATLRAMHLDDAEAFFVSYAADRAANPEKAVAFTASWDPSMIHRAEWIKFLAAFFNLEDKAEAHFKEIEAKWAALSAKTTDKVVAVISHQTWNNNAYRLELDPYKVMWIEAAGAKPLSQAEATASDYAKVGGCTPTVSNCDIDFNATIPEAVAAFHALVAKADVVIDETYAADAQAYDAALFDTTFGYDAASSPSASTYRCMQGLISGSGSSAWWEDPYARPEVLLQDLSTAVYGTGEDRFYCRKLSETFALTTAEHCGKPVPACGDGAFAVIDAPCETYQTCLTVDALTGEEGTTESTAAAAAAALFVALQI